MLCVVSKEALALVVEICCALIGVDSISIGFVKFEWLGFKELSTNYYSKGMANEGGVKATNCLNPSKIRGHLHLQNLLTP